MSNKLGTALVRELCIICYKAQDGPIIMNTTLTEKNAKDIEDMHGKIVGFAEEPCESCQEDIDKAFMIIGYDEDQSDMENLPIGFHRTGHIIGVKKDIPLVTEWVAKQVPHAIEKGYLFLPHVIMKDMNLIQEE